MQLLAGATPVRTVIYAVAVALANPIIEGSLANQGGLHSKKKMRRLSAHPIPLLSQCFEDLLTDWIEQRF